MTSEPLRLKLAEPAPTDPRAHMPQPTVASRPRQILHTIVAGLGWALFCWWWWIVVHRVSRYELRFTVWFVVVSFLTVVILTGAWVLHNRSIFNKRGPRTGVREARLDYSRDPLGRSVTFEAVEPELQRAPVVRVVVEPERKTYRLVPHRSGGNSQSA